MPDTEFDALATDDDPELKRRRAEADAKQAAIRDWLAQLPPEGKWIPTDMARGYPKGWDKSVIKPGKETKANQMDARTELGVPVRSWYEAGRAHFANGGPWGLAIWDFVKGIGTDHASKIGRFHEGNIIAMSVLTHMGRRPVCETAGMTITGEFRAHPDFGVETLHLKVVPNGRTEGTEWSFACSLEEYRAIMSMFLDEVPLEDLGGGILRPRDGYRTALYAKRLKIQDFEPLLFSYILDELADGQGRDREAVDTSAAMSLIGRKWRETASRTAIEAFFRRLAEAVARGKMPREKEYQCPIADWYYHLRYPALWQEILRQTWARPMLASSPACDFAAQIQGYTVLRVPPHTEELLRQLGVPSTATAGEPKAGWLEDNVISYPITARTRPSVIDAGREAIRNARFYGTDIRVEYRSGCIEVENQGPTVLVRHLAIGEGVDLAQREQFHEGITRMMLALAAEGRSCEMQAAGSTFTPMMELHPKLEVECLRIHITPNNRKEGVLVRFACSQEEYQTILDCFRSLDRPDEAAEDEVFLSDRPFLAVDGEVIERDVNLLFGWDLKGKGLLSRDRTAVLRGPLFKRMRRLLGNLTDSDLIRTYLTGWRERPEALEYLAGKVDVIRTRRELWEAVAEESLPKAAIAVETDMDAAAEDRGYEVLRHVPEQMRTLLPTVGVLDSVNSVMKKEKELPATEFIAPEELDSAEQANLEALKLVLTLLDPAWDWDRLRIVEEFTGGEWAEEQPDSVADPRKGLLYIRREVLASQERLDQVFHEHWTYVRHPRSKVRSREFLQHSNENFHRMCQLLRRALRQKP